MFLTSFLRNFRSQNNYYQFVKFMVIRFFMDIAINRGIQDRLVPLNEFLRLIALLAAGYLIKVWIFSKTSQILHLWWTFIGSLFPFHENINVPEFHIYFMMTTINFRIKRYLSSYVKVSGLWTVLYMAIGQNLNTRS